MENKTFVLVVVLTLLPLLLAGCEKATESAQKAVQDTKEIASNVTEDVTEGVKEETGKAVETTSETIAGVVDETKERADAIVENTTELAAGTAESTKETATESLDAATETIAGTVAEVKETLTPTSSSSSSNDEALALAKKSGCLACHKIDNKLVGPAWKDVAARYKGDAEATKRLIEKVSKGGKGNWTEVTGGAPMPPYSPRVSDEDIEKLVAFVLSL